MWFPWLNPTVSPSHKLHGQSGHHFDIGAGYMTEPRGTQVRLGHLVSWSEY